MNIDRHAAAAVPRRVYATMRAGPQSVVIDAAVSSASWTRNGITRQMCTSAIAIAMAAMQRRIDCCNIDTPQIIKRTEEEDWSKSTFSTQIVNS